MNSHIPEPVALRDKSPAGRKFEQSVEALDVATANRLRLMRREVLSMGKPGNAVRWWLPTGAFASVALLAMIGWVASQSLPHPSPVAVADVPTDVVLADDDEVELYAWLGDAPVATDAPGSNPL
jgi:hypothetical protein